MKGTFEVRGDNNKLIGKGKNTVTKRGRIIIGNCIMGTSRLNSIAVSAIDNEGKATTFFIDATYLDIEIGKSFVSVDGSTSNLVIRIDASGERPEGLNNIKSVGVALDKEMVTASTVSNLDVSGETTINISYKLEFKI